MNDYDEVCRLLAQIDALHRTAYPDRFQEVLPVREKSFLQFYLDKHDIKTWVAATVDKKLAGLIMVEIRYTPSLPIIRPRSLAMIEVLVVDEAHRRQGIGQQLMAQALAWAKHKQVNEIQLAVWEFNEDAIRFYEALGYQTLHRRMVFNLD